MKQILHANKSIHRIGFVLLFVALTFTSIGASSPVQDEQNSPATQLAFSDYLAAQQNANLSDEGKIKAAIEAYFTSRYEGQKTLERQDFSLLLQNEDLDWVKKENDKRDIELYVAELFNLRYQSYKYTIDYESIEIKDKEAVVYLKENYEVVFNAIAPSVSKLAGLPHKFSLYYKEQVWVIDRDAYEDELSRLLEYSTKDEIKQQADENLKNEQRDEIPTSKALVISKYTPLGLTNRAYNRTKAVNYADTYWKNYNTAWYIADINNDYTNFVSQSLYAGEGKTPPNTSGMTTASNRDYYTDWYYVWNNSGSLPWIRVQEQYNFLIGNNSANRIGPYGSPSTDYRQVSPGDIVQIKQSSIWDHEGIIVVKDATPATTLLNAHSANRYHYPLAYWVFSWRFILINGWRG